MSEVLATLSTSLNQRAPADIPLERKSPDLHGAGISRRPAVFDYSWTTRDASASWRLQGTLGGNLRAVRFSALWCALLQTLEWRYRFTASADVCDQALALAAPLYKVSKTRGRTRTPRALEKQRPAAFNYARWLISATVGSAAPCRDWRTDARQATEHGCESARLRKRHQKHVAITRSRSVIRSVLICSGNDRIPALCGWSGSAGRFPRHRSTDAHSGFRSGCIAFRLIQAAMASPSASLMATVLG